MEKKNKKSSSDELALVKAAAWAWYQHGSSSEGKPMAMREFGITRTERASRPSRFKLEAMRNNTLEGSQTATPIHNDNSLLDSYEIESISKQIDHLLEFSGIKFYDELFSIDGDHSYRNNLVLDSGKKKKTRSKLKGFLLRRAVLCGRNQDVDDKAFKDDDDRRIPRKHAPLIDGKLLAMGNRRLVNLQP